MGMRLPSRKKTGSKSPIKLSTKSKYCDNVELGNALIFKWCCRPSTLYRAGIACSLKLILQHPCVGRSLANMRKESKGIQHREVS